MLAGLALVAVVDVVGGVELDAGYGAGIGLYGIHRYFHTAGDDMRCISGDLVAPVAAAFRTAIMAILA